MEQNETSFLLKNTTIFECKFCDFISYNKFDYERHLRTVKHKKLKNKTKYENIQKNARTFQCEFCQTIIGSRTTFWRHKKKCNITMDKLIEPQDQQELIQYLMKENTEFKQLMIEQNKQIIELAKTGGHNTTNNQFNLQIYLNETCKNAMNIMDFVSQLQVGIYDLEETGRLGFANGISRIFINGLKNIDVSDRPIHCSDFKRETIYIRNNNEWNKDTTDKSILTNAIKHVSHKNMKQISEWTKMHPEYKDSESKENDRYLRIVSESMSGSTEEETQKNYMKIIKNIVKETVIEKS